jgi:hypothetical protein
MQSDGRKIALDEKSAENSALFSLLFAFTIRRYPRWNPGAIGLRGGRRPTVVRDRSKVFPAATAWALLLKNSALIARGLTRLDPFSHDDSNL